MCMYMFTPAIFPYARVRFEGEAGRPFAERFERAKQPGIARPRQPPVEKHRRRRHDNAAVDIVLVLMNGRVADAHRAIPAVTGKSRGVALGEVVRVHDAEDLSLI